MLDPRLYFAPTRGKVMAEPTPEIAILFGPIRTLADRGHTVLEFFARSDGHAIRWGNPPGIDVKGALPR